MEISNYIKEITPEMTRTVDNLLSRNFEGATPEEIEIYAQWTKLNALQQAEFTQARELRKQLVESQIAQSEEQAESAINALNSLAELAQAKLEMVSNG